MHQDILLPEPVDILPDLRGVPAQVAGESAADPREPVPHERHQPGELPEEIRGRVGYDRLDPGQDLRLDAAYDRPEDLVLAGEILVQRGLADAQSRCDLFGRDRGEAAPEKELARFGDDALSEGFVAGAQWKPRKPNWFS